MKLTVQQCTCGRFRFAREHGFTPFYKQADYLEQIRKTHEITTVNVECDDCNKFSEVRVLAGSVH